MPKTKEVQVYTGTEDQMFLVFAIPRSLVEKAIQSTKRAMLDFEMELSKIEAFDLLRAIADVPRTMEMMKKCGKKNTKRSKPNTKP